jgi:aminoglycoside phosphotransferase (APT) family kinase protein
MPMESNHAERPSMTALGGWLADHHGSAIADLGPLRGGFWSAAYGYRVGADEFVLRLGDVPEGFTIDRAAMRFGSPALPVPDVLEIGDAFGLSFAISRRHHGRFIESVTVNDAPVAGRTLDGLLAALRAVPASASDPVLWHAVEAEPFETWRRWLLDGLVDDPGHRVSGWRAALAADRRVDRVFRACEARVGALLDACPERRDLVHGDLLHQNVLVADDASRVTAVFSWKCSVRGDFLFDVAWCSFWGAWHPGIAATDPWHSILSAPDLGPADLDDAELRHHCYELQIAASQLGWSAWTGDGEGLRAIADEAEILLERGPLAR